MGIGNSIANTIAEKQKQMQQEMMEKQMKNQVRGQERMRRMMIAQQMAMTRERLYWMGGFGAFAALGLTHYTVTHGFPRFSVPPILLYSFIMGYQIDFAYGNKAERINNMANEILVDPQYWFVPVMPDENDPTLEPRPNKSKQKKQ